MLQRANGKDIVKKTSIRKNRYMLLFNVSITPKAGGKLVRPAAQRGAP